MIRAGGGFRGGGGVSPPPPAFQFNAKLLQPLDSFKIMRHHITSWLRHITTSVWPQHQGTRMSPRLGFCCRRCLLQYFLDHAEALEGNLCVLESCLGEGTCGGSAIQNNDAQILKTDLSIRYFFTQCIIKR